MSNKIVFFLNANNILSLNFLLNVFISTEESVFCSLAVKSGMHMLPNPSKKALTEQMNIINSL